MLTGSTLGKLCLSQVSPHAVVELEGAVHRHGAFLSPETHRELSSIGGLDPLWRGVLQPHFSFEAWERSPLQRIRV